MKETLGFIALEFFAKLGPFITEVFSGSVLFDVTLEVSLFTELGS